MEALTLWFRRAAAEGHLVPTDHELAAIAADPAGWQDSADSDVVDAWSPTIGHLLHQMKFGVEPEVAVDITGDLTRPSRPIAAPPVPPVPIDPPPGVDPPDPGNELLQRLRQWRSQRIADGAEGADSIKDTTLANLVKWNNTDAEQIRKKLPGPSAYLAPEISAVMLNADAAERSSAPPPVVRTPVVPPPVVEQPVQSEQTIPSPANGTVPPGPTASVSPPPRHRAPEGVLLNLDHSAFSPYEYGDSDVEVSPITVKATPDGVRLTFDPYVPDAGKMVIYRVVSGEGGVPHKPEVGDIVAVTTGLTVEDGRFATSAVRNYQVWCHVGLDQEDACRAQPFKLAEAADVSPVDDFALTEDEGRVIGQWSVFEGTRAVRVYRIPLDGMSSSSEELHRICTEDPNLTGFVDTGAERGKRYLYRARAEVVVGESPRLSKAVQQELQVSVVLQPVTDLTVAVHEGDDSQFDLSWSAPVVGSVKVYRLAAPPPAGLDNGDMSEAQLEPQGFNEQSRIKHPVTSAGPQRSQMRGVPWPADWQRAYLVPVTVLNGRARVGATTITTRKLPPVSDMEIIERFHTEVVTFGWPTGAASVKAFVGLDSMSPEEICFDSQATEEINEARYRRDGGLAFSKRLAPTGCTVCLVPVAYSRGEEIRGQITAQRYPGLARVEYGLSYLPDSDTAQLWLQADTEIEFPPPLMLINNVDRFPLSVDDGQYVTLTKPDRTRLPQCTIDHIARDATNTGWTIDLSEVHGFFRLFFGPQQPGSRPLALKDPTLGDLYREPYRQSPPGAAQ